MAPGNLELGKLIREIASREALTAAEKAQLLAEGAGRISGVSFEPLPNVSGVQAVFRGTGDFQRGNPLLVILLDGRVFRGFTGALIPNPAGGNGFAILINRLREIK